MGKDACGILEEESKDVRVLLVEGREAVTPVFVRERLAENRQGTGV